MSCIEETVIANMAVFCCLKISKHFVLVCIYIYYASEVVKRGMYVESKKAFQRNFLIFNAEDKGFEAGQKPSGYVRIEVRDGRGKLWLAAQNLAAGDGKPAYRLYLIKTDGENAAAVCAGLLKLHNNRAELEWEFDPDDVHRSGYNISEFDVAAVLAEYSDQKNTRVISPLAAYKNKKTEWRKALEKQLYNQYPTPQETVDEDVISKYEGKAESKYIPPETLPYYNIPDLLSTMKNAEAEGNEPSTLPESNEYQQQYDSGVMPVETPVQTVVQTSDQENAQINSQAMPQVNAVQNPPLYANPAANCVYMNGNMCGMYLNTGGTNPCKACHVNAQDHGAAKSEEQAGDINKLKEQLDQNFEQSDPFQSKRSDYKWWKVLNPVNLNNILYQCNIKSPLLFNPLVMMAHFKYRHLIIGIFTDKAKRREYVVCGVPGMNMVDRKPFGDMCRWVQAEANRPRYGGFGYWIVYIEPETGKILSLK